MISSSFLDRGGVTVPPVRVALARQRRTPPSRCGQASRGRRTRLETRRKRASGAGAEGLILSLSLSHLFSSSFHPPPLSTIDVVFLPMEAESILFETKPPSCRDHSKRSATHSVLPSIFLVFVPTNHEDIETSTSSRHSVKKNGHRYIFATYSPIVEAVPAEEYHRFCWMDKNGQDTRRTRPRNIGPRGHSPSCPATPPTACRA